MSHLRRKYQSGSFASPLAWEQNLRHGAMKRMFDPEAGVKSGGLRGLTSAGSMGHLFAGSSGGNPFSVGGPATPATAAAVPRKGADFYGLRDATPYAPVAKATPVAAPVVRPTMPDFSGPGGRTNWDNLSIAEREAANPVFRQQMAEFRQRNAGTLRQMGYQPKPVMGPPKPVSPSTPTPYTGWKDYTGKPAPPSVGYQKGTLPSSGFASLPDEARRLESEGADPTWMLRKVMNSIPTLAGLGLGVAKGATFGPGPGDTIIAEYDEEDPNRQDAQTLGEVILRRRGMPEGTKDQVTEHELGHVEQGKFLGPLLPAASGIAALVQSLRGRDPYLENPFETSAPAMGAEAMKKERLRKATADALMAR